MIFLGMKSKKGQLGKIITALPVLILIFFIIGIYLVLTGFAYVFKGASLFYFIEGVDTNDFLFHEIQINGQKMLLLDALIQFQEKKIERDMVNEEFKRLVDDQNNFLLLASGFSEMPGGLLGGQERNNFIIKLIDGEKKSPNYGSFHSTFGEYRRKGLLQERVFEIRREEGIQKFYIEFYFGREKT